jgi:hypothetical protein
MEQKVMPDHVHLLVDVDPQFGIHRWVKPSRVGLALVASRVRAVPHAPAIVVDERVFGGDGRRRAAKDREAHVPAPGGLRKTVHAAAAAFEGGSPRL